MLYFSKLKVTTIYSIIVFLSFFSILNFLQVDKNLFFSKKVNLGLDLQGGSYLLLEVDSSPIIKRNLQNKLILIRKTLIENNIGYENLTIKGETIKFQIQQDKVEKFENLFLDKKNTINNYFDKYSSYEMDYFFENNLLTIHYSRFGIIELKNSALDLSLEIVRRRIDEVGTKDPTIIRRGNDRI